MHYFLFIILLLHVSSMVSFFFLKNEYGLFSDYHSCSRIIRIFIVYSIDEWAWQKNQTYDWRRRTHKGIIILYNTHHAPPRGGLLEQFDKHYIIIIWYFISVYILYMIQYCTYKKLWCVDRWRRHRDGIVFSFFFFFNIIRLYRTVAHSAQQQLPPTEEISAKRYDDRGINPLGGSLPRSRSAEREYFRTLFYIVLYTRHISGVFWVE